MGQHIYFDSVLHKNMRGGRPSSHYFVQSTAKTEFIKFFHFSRLAYIVLILLKMCIATERDQCRSKRVEYGDFLLVYNGLTPQSCSSEWKTEVTGYLSRLQAGPRRGLQHESCHVLMAACQLMYNTVHRKTSTSNHYLVELLVPCLDFRTPL